MLHFILDVIGDLVVAVTATYLLLEGLRYIHGL